MLMLMLACRPVLESAAPWQSPLTETGTTETDPEPTGDCADRDDDGDGVDACADCDDGDPASWPGAYEACDGVDQDCDGSPHPDEVDRDADGVLDCAACDSAGYWRWILDETDGAALWDTLNALSGPISCFYSDATDQLFLEVDNHDHEVACVYTGAVVEVFDEKPDDSVMNTEHTWPQSEGADTEPAKCDLHHLYPTVTEANEVRGNNPFGEVTGAASWSDGGSSLGAGAGGTVFEPRDDHKGNVARSMLYFAMRYGFPLSADEVALYQAWHVLDPIDLAEVERSALVLGLQGNGNPFVVCPGAVEAVPAVGVGG